MSKRISFLSFVLSAIVLALMGCTPEDADSPLPEDFFIKYYGSSSTETMLDILPYNDGYLLLGSTNETDDLDYLLVKTDAFGNELWKKQIGYVRDATNADDRPSEMILYDEFHVAIIGTTKFAIPGDEILGSRVLVAIVNVSSDTDADIIADDIIFPEITDGASAEEIKKANSEGYSLLRPTTDGISNFEDALILVGSSDSVDTKPGPEGADIQDVYMVKAMLDLANGTATATGGFENFFGFNGEDIGTKVLQFTSGFVVIGSTESGSVGAGKNVLFDIVNLDGSVSDGPIFGGDADDVPTDVDVSGTNITILGNSSGGSSGQQAFLIQTTSTGGGVADLKPISIPSSIATNSGNIGNSIVRLQNGNLFVAGQLLGYQEPAPSNLRKEGEIILYKTDQLAIIDSTSVQIFGGIGNDQGVSIIQNTDQTLMIGATIDFQGSTTMMSLLKTNSSGKFAK